MDPLVVSLALAAAGGALIGLLLSVFGGGGSVLATPLLLYVVGVRDPHVAIGTSAAAVAVNALVGLGAQAKAGRVKWPCALVFGGAGLAGSLVGAHLAKMIDGGQLILWFAGRELWRLRHAQALPVRPAWLTRLITLGAGLSHGLFASGGPLLVYGLAGTELDKARLRATLVSVWFSLNSLLTVAFLLDGRLLPALPQVASYAPLLLLGVWLGERLHRRFDERHFRIAIYCLLLLTGTLLLAPWRLA